MLYEALRIAIVGFIVVIATFSILAVSVKIMSSICMFIDKKGKKIKKT